MSKNKDKQTKLSNSDGKIFTITSKTALLEENKDGQPVLEETVKTYSATKKGNRVSIKELGRKNKRPLSIKTFNVKKGETVQTVIKDILTGKKVLPAKHINQRSMYETEIKNGHVIRKKTGTVDVVQTNYLGKISYVNQGITIKIKPQMVCLVKVIDHDQHITDHFVGYSKRMKTSRPRLTDISQAEQECKLMAITKFLSKYGSKVYNESNYKESLTYFETIIIEKRFQYWKSKRLKSALR